MESLATLPHLDGYRVESLLARGGMGEVYLAWDERLERRVALKRLRADRGSVTASTRGNSAGSERRRRRFQREARAAARLNHPAVVRIYDVVVAEEGEHIVMEYVEGSRLRELVRDRPLELSLALRLAGQIAGGLAEAHAKGLVHRDLKAENVVVTPEGHAKVLDFGLVRLVGGEGDRASLTAPGDLLGTFHAMSPEQAAGEPVDHRCDLFAFGVLLYEMLTAHSPFQGETPVDTLRRVVQETPRPVAELRPEVPPGLSELVGRLLEKDPEQRPPSIRLVAMELAAFTAADLSVAFPAAGVPDAPKPPVSSALDDELTGSALESPLAARPPGEDLAAWAERRDLAAMPLETRLEIVAEIAETLAAEHAVGKLHKDLRPANVLAVEDGEEPPRWRLVHDGAGDRLRYLAPEVLEGKPPTIQSDLYALGVLLYQVVVGDFSRALAPGWHRDVTDELLLDDMARFVDGVPERRPASALEIAERLRDLEERRARLAVERAARQEARRLAVAVERGRRRRRWIAGIAALTTAVAVVVTLLALGAARARDEADRRRGQAENLIAFMLGDLRRELEPVGRLGILSRVGEKALEYFREVPEEKLSDEERRQRARAFHQIGSVELDLGHFTSAAEAFGTSLELARALTERRPGDAEWQFELGQSLFWVGQYYLEKRDLDRAWEYFQAYYEIAEDLSAHDKVRADWRLELAYAHSNLASVLQLRGEPAAALLELEESAAVFDDLLGRQADNVSSPLKSPQGDNAAWQLELSHVLSKIGTILLAEGDLSGALETFRTTLAIRRGLAEPQDRDADLTRYLATVHNHLGFVLEALGEPRRALAHLQRDLELTTGLTALDPDSATWKRELLVSHKDLGRVLRKLGETASAAEHLRSALALGRELVERDPGHLKWRLELAACHRELAALDLAKAEPARALEWARQAEALFADAAAAAPDDPEVQRRWGGILWLLGQVLDTLGHKSEARVAWERSVELGESPARASRDVRLLVVAARPLLSLGESARARPIVEKLAASGFRDPEYLELCRAQAFCDGGNDTAGPASTKDEPALTKGAL